MKGRIKRPENRGSESLARVGFIKCGYKDDRGIPHSLDHFIADGKYSELFHKTYGEKPNSITIFFPSDNMEDVANERYELRDNSGKLVAYGDGENFMLHDPKTNEYNPVSGDALFMGNLAAKYHTDKYKAEWKETLTLKFFISGVKVYGLWWLSTKGDESSIPTITGTLDSLMEFPGTIVGIPMNLNIEKVKSNKPGDKSVYPVITLIPDLTQEKKEKLNLLIQNNIAFKGMLLTDERVDSLAGQIEPKRYSQEAPALPESTAGAIANDPNIQDAEVVEDAAKKIEDKFSSPAPYTIEDAMKELEDSATSKQALAQAAKGILQKAKWSADDKVLLDKKFREVAKHL